MMIILYHLFREEGGTCISDLIPCQSLHEHGGTSGFQIEQEFLREGNKRLIKKRMIKIVFVNPD